jgi:hypothetical protein
VTRARRRAREAEHKRALLEEVLRKMAAEGYIVDTGEVDARGQTIWQRTDKK